MKLSFRPLDLRLKVPFRISRGTTDVARNVLVEIHQGGLVGYGEGAPTTSAYYGETQGTMLAILEELAPAFAAGPDGVEETLARLDTFLVLRRNGAVRAALETALLDLLGKQLGAPLHRLWGLPAGATALTSFTIGIDTPERMAEGARAAADCPILKIKLGTDDDDARVRAIREARPDARLHVDANAAWRPKQALAAIEQIARYGIEFVEQPVAGPDLAGLRFVRERSPLPIFADESCVRLEDVPRVAEAADGVVVKLMKCGGPRQALALIHVARAHGLQVMLGSMVESAVAVTAAAHLTPLVDYADLDGILLLADHPFAGVRIERGKLVLPAGPGLGVRPATGG